MAKDWEHYRREFIAYMFDTVNVNLDGFGKLTPIEGIAGIHLLYLLFRIGSDNFSITTQQKIDRYTVDFLLIYFPKNLKIVIECDGHDFHEKTKEQAAHDKERDRYFTTSGYKVLRYTGSEICIDPEKIIRDVLEIVGIDVTTTVR